MRSESGDHAARLPGARGVQFAKLPVGAGWGDVVGVVGVNSTDDSAVGLDSAGVGDGVEPSGDEMTEAGI